MVPEKAFFNSFKESLIVFDGVCIMPAASGL